MALWLVRAGPAGEYEELALEKNIAVIGWSAVGDLTDISTREELLQRLEAAYPEAKRKTLFAWAGQLWSFAKGMQEGDLIALPLKQRPAVALGRIAGEYKYRPIDQYACHVRPVEWLREIPRTAFDSDLLYSLGSLLTVCRLRRNSAEERIRSLLEEKQAVAGVEAPIEGEEESNLEEIALDQIRRFISQRFRGHSLTRLVAAVLSAQGYRVSVAPAGPDGGVDILAGAGGHGFGEPRIAVQVKSADEPADIRTVRELQGAMKNFRATHGLFVAWGGFRRSVRREAATAYFEIRLWDSDDLLREILKYYEKLPADIQTELPLKRIWTLVPSPPAP